MSITAMQDEQSDAVLVDTGIVHIEELRGPDQLPSKERKLRAYLTDTDDIGQRSLQPTTGDQVVFRVKESSSNPSGAAFSDGAGQQQLQQQQQFSPQNSPGAQLHSGGIYSHASTSSTPRTSGPQVAVLGSPQVPVGLSSALGYLHLGQVARVKVPPHLLGQGVADDTGAVQDIGPPPTSTGLSQSPQQRQQFQSSYAHQASSRTAAAGSPGQATTSPRSPAGGAATAPSASTHTSTTSTAGQQQQDVGSHPIDVVEAVTHGTTPVHSSTTGSSPGHRKHRFLPHRSHNKQQHQEDTPPASPTAAGTGLQSRFSEEVRRYSDPFIVRPKGWAAREQQQQLLLQQQQQVEVVSVSTTATSSSAATPRNSRVAAAAAHAAAATSGNPIRRAVAAAMGKAQPVGPLPPPTNDAAQGAPAVSGSRPPGASSAAAGGVPATAPLTSAGPAAHSSSSPSPNSSHWSGPSGSAAGEAAVGFRPSPSPAALQASLPSSPSPSDPAFTAASGSSLPAGTTTTTITTSSMVPASGRSGSPAPGRSPSPSVGRGIYSSTFPRPDRGLGADKTARAGSSSSSGPQGINFSRISPQASAEAAVPATSEAVVPATPRPSPATEAGLLQRLPGGVRALVSRLQQQAHMQGSAEASPGVKSPRSQPTSPTAASGQTPVAASMTSAARTSPAARAYTGGVASSQAATPAAAGAGAQGSMRRSSESSSDAGFYTPSAAAGTPFFTPGTNTPLSAASDVSGTMTDNDNSGSAPATGSSFAANSSSSSSKLPHSRLIRTLDNPGAADGSRRSSSSSTTNSAGGLVSSPPRVLQQPYQQTGQQRQVQQRLSFEQVQQQAAATGSRGGMRYEMSSPGGGSAARQLQAGGSSTTAAAAAATAPNDGLRARFTSRQPQDSTALLQAAADKLRQHEYEHRAAAAGSLDTLTAAGRGQDMASDSSRAAQQGLLPGAAAAESAQHTSPQQQSNWGFSHHPSTSPDVGSSGSRSVLADVPRSNKPLPLLPEKGSTSEGASLRFSSLSSARASQDTQQSADTGPVSFNRWLSHEAAGSSGVRGSSSDIMAAAAALAAAEGRPVPSGTPAGAAAAGGGIVAAATPAPRTGNTDADAAAYPEVRLSNTSVAPAAAAVSGPVSPSKALAAAVMVDYNAAIVASSTSGQSAASSSAVTPVGAVPGSPEQPAVVRLQQPQPAPLSPAAAGLVPASATYTHEVEHALLPTQPASRRQDGAAGGAAAVVVASSSSSSSITGGGDVGGRRSDAAAARRASAEDGGRSSTDATGRVTGDAAADAPTSGAAGAEQAAADTRVEYEVEVLAVIPGHGPLSGEPVLSEAAQQEHISRADIRAAAAAATNDEPALKPPKPRKGFSGWVRRHMSLNVGVPWRAGKQGATMLGLRGCCKKPSAKEAEDEAGAPKPQGEQAYQSWME